jgi:hypothetical protein
MIDYDLIRMGNTCDMFDWVEDLVPQTSADERTNIVVHCATCKIVAELVNDIEAEQWVRICEMYKPDKNKRFSFFFKKPQKYYSNLETRNQRL